MMNWTPEDLSLVAKPWKSSTDRHTPKCGTGTSSRSSQAQPLQHLHQSKQNPKGTNRIEVVCGTVLVIHQVAHNLVTEQAAKQQPCAPNCTTVPNAITPKRPVIDPSGGGSACTGTTNLNKANGDGTRTDASDTHGTNLLAAPGYSHKSVLLKDREAYEAPREQADKTRVHTFCQVVHCKHGRTRGPGAQPRAGTGHTFPNVPGKAR
jgi:hypothetical protein